MPPTAAPTPPRPVFQGDMAAAVTTLRRRLATIIESVCGSHPRAQDVTDKFGVYRKLGWQLWNVAYAEDPMAAIRHLPNPRTLKVWTEAALAKGVAREQLARWDDALALFHKSVSLHADDRETLEMLVESHSPDEESAARWRKQAFVGNAFTFGVRAKCMFSMAIVFPSRSRGGYLDLVRVQGLLGLIRTRPGVRWPFAQLLFRDNNAAVKTPNRVPLAESAATRETGVPVLEEHCSSPLPPLRRYQKSETVLEDELLAAEAGQSGSADIVTAEIIREALPYTWGAPSETATYGTGIRTPAELLVSDLLMSRSLYPNARRDLMVFGELMTPFSRDDRDRIPVPETCQALGPVSDGIATADVPRHGDLLADVMARAGLDAADFDAYRIRMKYPPIPVSVVIRHSMASSS